MNKMIMSLSLNCKMSKFNTCWTSSTQKMRCSTGSSKRRLVQNIWQIKNYVRFNRSSKIITLLVPKSCNTSTNCMMTPGMWALTSRTDRLSSLDRSSAAFRTCKCARIWTASLGPASCATLATSSMVRESDHGIARMSPNRITHAAFARTVTSRSTTPAIPRSKFKWINEIESVTYFISAKHFIIRSNIK